MASAEEAQTVEDQGTAAGSGSKASVGANFVINLALSGPLNQVWGMINGL